METNKPSILNRIFFIINFLLFAKIVCLSHSTHKSPIKIMLRKLLTPNIQRIKSIRAIGAVLQ